MLLLIGFVTRESYLTFLGLSFFICKMRVWARWPVESDLLKSSVTLCSMEASDLNNWDFTSSGVVRKEREEKKNYLHSCKSKVNFKICKYIYIKLVIFLLLKGNGTCSQMRQSYEILFYVEGLGLDGCWWWMFLPPWPWSPVENTRGEFAIGKQQGRKG